tara:strand:- start:1020 stop:1211 length:192 start_codon:yes stop_codon:yes gene_type:complete
VGKQVKKLLLPLLIVPMVSFGQIQVQLSGQQPTYNNPNPQPIKVQVQNSLPIQKTRKRRQKSH